jgi:DNA-binding transcriptional MerR regulator
MGMWTITRLARKYGLSRGTVLYYESIGVMERPARTSGNYRAYSEKDAQRLAEIVAYRHVGLGLEDIRLILTRPQSGASLVLTRRLLEIDREVAKLRAHQRSILRLLGNTKMLERTTMITKERWVSIMSAAGFTETDMGRWHAEFERSAPDEHQEFLEFLRVPKGEIQAIRSWSATWREGKE